MIMDLSVIIITSIALALIYVFIIKPRQDKKAAEAKRQQEEKNANASCENISNNVERNEPEEKSLWPLFEEKELRTMGWEFVFCKEQWEEVNILLKAGKYDEAEKKTLEFQKKYMDSIIEFDLLLLEAQHRKGDFNACAETYKKTNRPSLAFFSAKNKTPLVLEYCEAMLDLQGTIPVYIQLAWKGAHDCLDGVMKSNPPERSYIICIRAFKAALDVGLPLFGGNEGDLIKDYIKSGLSWHPESKTLLEMQSSNEQTSHPLHFR